MENNRTSDVFPVVAGVPSGLEVEGARLHRPTESSTHISGLARPAWRERLDTIRSRGVSKLGAVRSSAMTHVGSMRSGVARSVSSTEHHLRTHAGLWAGAAAGAGFTLGILGRLMLYRKQRAMPDVIVISGTC